MLSCKQASQLVSQGLDKKLSTRELIALKFHLFLCKYCSRFNRQLKNLHVVISNMGKQVEDDANITLPPETKKRIMDSVASKD